MVIPKNSLVAGIDEVGRGALAGPLYAAAAMFQVGEDITCPIKGVKDSKTFGSQKGQMKEVYLRILRSTALEGIGIGWASVMEIDKLGIDMANSMAFERALKDLPRAPQLLFVDGVNAVHGYPTLWQHVLPKADSLFWPVSAASIVAKIVRDEYMTDLDEDYPLYAWKQNAGYGAAAHREALQEHGASPQHRKQFVRRILGEAKKK